MSAIPTTALEPAPPVPALAPPNLPLKAEPALRAPTKRQQPSPIGTRSGWSTSLCLLLADGGAIFLSGLGGYFTFQAIGLVASVNLLPVFGLLGALQMAGMQAAGLHRPWGIGPVASLARIVTITLTAAFVFAAITLTVGQPWQLSATLLIAGFCSALLIPMFRSAVHLLLGCADWWGRRVFVIGSDQRAVALYTNLLRQPQRGLRPVGFVDDLETLDTDLDPTLYLGPPDALRELALEYGVSAAVVAKADPDDQTQRLFCREEVGIRDWILMSALDGYPSLWGQAVEVGGVPALWARNRLLSPGSRLLKRSADLVIGLASILLTLPFIVAIIALVRLSSPGPAFYGQERIGRHGRRFKAWKFRTMVVNADEVLEKYLATDPLLRAEWEANHKLKVDPRVTWIGNFLRKTSLDELPQLWNVLCGEMSLVGPRPIVEAEIDKYADEYEYYVDVLPGITGLWQVSGRNNTTYPERVAFDAYYVKNWSLWLDLYILISTVRVIMFREGAY